MLVSFFLTPSPAWTDGFKKRKIIFYLFERQSYKERERQRRRQRVFPSADSVPDGHDGQCWANLKPGARSFFWVSHVGAGVQGLGPSSTAFPDHSRELDQKWSSWDSNQCPYGMLALQATALPATPQHRPIIF